MYSLNQPTEAISARLAPGLKDRIDFETAQYGGENRNNFINRACELALFLRHEIRCGNIKPDELPNPIRQYSWFLHLERT